ncbi:DUF2782 domain-containing protein [Chitinilyticum litopenaei]|uniref:DUF2782 domain-containing protein n=1 Tax=Chitinilyticum litopenaei TaxID=1121276 RepID=UPI00048DE28B|nr:DUF2782 domain-containing protein [Chitinilyticum litopenaei]
MNRLLLPALFAALSLPALAADDPAAPPPMPENTAPATQEAEPEVRIVTEENRTLTEYRLKGRLYMVKITPKSGKPYYLVDEAGAGNFTRRDEPLPALSVPRWVLFEW